MQVLSIQKADRSIPVLLSEDECDAVNGGVGLVGAAIGAAVSGSTYVGSVVGSGNGSFRGLAAAMGTGAVTGFFTPIPAGAMAAGASVISGSFIGFYAGMAGGFVERIW